MTKKSTVEYLQMDLIPPTEIESLTKNVEEIKESCDKVRKGMFKRHSELAKKIEALECQLKNLEMRLGKILLGFAPIAQKEPAESGPTDTSQHSIKIYAMCADASQQLQVPGIGDMRITGKSA